MTVGISGYGVYIPRLRIKREEYSKAWGSFAAAGVSEKAVLGFDEDALTAASKVARRALESVPMPADKVTRFALASTSAPAAKIVRYFPKTFAHSAAEPVFLLR